jgi:beta-lactam-binding protein with PASTA domain/serine/threonine protein kinase
VDRTAADPMTGRVLEGRYRVGPRIARGGMATVYEATDLRLDRVCALKVMHPGLGDDGDFAARFVREARSAARLSHPNVVAIFDQGDDDGTVFLAMELVRGHTLRDVIRAQAPMSPARALQLLDPVLCALAAAHQAGLVHRDVKPENVLLADDGTVKVADFGLARAVSAETQHSATGGVLIGTVSYLSPELVVDGKADARSDVYAAGVVLYEMLTGRKPHEGESPIQVAYKHVHEDVPPPSRVAAGIPTYVDALVARATARDRDLRPTDARVLLHQVRRVKVALDHGVHDDAELTSDLTPTMPVQRLRSDDIDYVRDEPVATILTPEQLAHGGRTDETGDTGDTSDTSEIRAPAAGRPTKLPARRRRRGPLLLALLLLLAVAAGTGGWWLGEGRFASTPGVLNLSAAVARDRVEAAGLSFEVGGRAYSETVARGSVVRTDPAGGENVDRNGTVVAYVSMGPERHAVPRLAGLSLDAAQAALLSARLSYGTATYRYSETVPRGTVVRSDPAPSTQLRRSGVVDVVVSRGPRPVRVPDLSGKDADAAARALTRRGFKVRTGEQHSDTVERGDVVTQTPDSGTLFRGDVVDLVVSLGPVLVDVPAVVSRNVDDATAMLQAAGFTVRSVESELYIGLRVVVRQSPRSGDRVPRGSTITLSLV